VISFAEMMVIGFRTLNFSAEVAGQVDDEPIGWKDQLIAVAIMVLTFSIAIGIFFFAPLAISAVAGLQQRPVAYNVVAGGVRTVLLLSYIWAIGRLSDIRRVFAYHGAEHQVVFAFEAGRELTVESAREYSRFHPRCGTSFLLIVVLLAILAYALIDTSYALVIGHAPGLLERFAVHMLFLPLVAGISFEALKASGKYRHSRLVRAMIAPGLWLQHLTTRQPDDEQLSVAVEAARASLSQTSLVDAEVRTVEV